MFNDDNYSMGYGLLSNPVIPELNKRDQVREIRYAVSQQAWNMAISRFTYEDLPDKMTSTKIETILSVYGYAILAKVNGLWDVYQGAIDASDFNAYGRPIKASFQSESGDDIEITNGVDGYILGNRPDYSSTQPIINSWGNSIINMEILRLSNAQLLATIPVFKTDDQNIHGAELTILRNALKTPGIEDFGLIAAKDKQGNTISGDLETVEMHQDYVGAELETEIKYNWERISDALGLNTVHRNTDSGISDNELENGLDASHASGLIAFTKRKEDWTDINELFDFNVTAHWIDNVTAQKVEDEGIYDEDSDDDVYDTDDTNDSVADI